MEAQQKSMPPWHMQSLPDSHLPAARTLTFAICVRSTNLQAVPSGTSQQESLPGPMASPGGSTKTTKNMKKSPVIAAFFKQFDTQKNIQKMRSNNMKLAVDSLFGSFQGNKTSIFKVHIFFEPPFWLKAVPALSVLSSPADDSDLQIG